MDPKQHQLSKLDPKLKEAYERVMSGTPPPADGAAASVPDLTAKHVEPAAVQPPSPQPSTTQSETISEPVTKPQATTTPITQTIATPIKTTAPQKIHLGYQSKPQKIASQKKKVSIPAPIYVIGGVVFFILYTLFWVKVFNIPLPFLP